ncbi:DUF305 domain-containing protein [Micromonosporaceae bacterium Da 78-11]
MATWHAGEADNRNSDNNFRTTGIVISALPTVNMKMLTWARINEQNPVVKANHRIILAGVLTVTALGLPGCRTAPSAPTVAPTSATASPVAGEFGGTDLAWIEINIAMDEELLPMLDLVATRSRDSTVQALALQVRAFNDSELGTLRALHDRAALPAENPHKGMPMPGMVTPEQVTAAAALTGPAFDTVVVEHIRAHLRQGADLAHSESKSGIEPQTRSLALQVIRTREQVLPTIKQK